MTALEIIRLTMPEFDQVPDDKVEKWITLARPLVSEEKFGQLYEQAVALLTAHKMGLAGAGGTLAGTKLSMASGQGLASVSEGETSISFDTAGTSLAATDPMAAEYAKTIYGLQYLSLCSQVLVNIVIDWSGAKWQK